MTDEQKRIAIAEACGWKRGTRRVGTVFEGLAWLMPNGKSHHPHEWFGLDNLPDYLTDLNAMHEAENILYQQGLFGEYVFTLAGLNDASWKNGINFERIAWESMLCKVAKATAAHRADAFLATLKLS